MAANTAPETPSVPEGATRNVKVSFQGQLDSGELLSGTPSVAEVTTTDLTITGKALNSETITVNEDTGVLASQAVIFTVTGFDVDNSPYTIKITVDTDAGQTLIGYTRLLAGNS